MSADSTSAAREECWREGDCGCPDAGHTKGCVERGFDLGVKWARSQPRVVSEASVEAAVFAIESNYGGNAYDDMRVALAAAYAVEEQRNANADT